MKLILIIPIFIAIFASWVNCVANIENESEKKIVKNVKGKAKITMFREPCGNFPQLRQLKKAYKAIRKHMKSIDSKNFKKFSKLRQILRTWGSQHYNCCQVLDKQFRRDYPLLRGYTVDMDKVEQVLDYYRNMMNAKFGFLESIARDFTEVLKHHLNGLDRTYIMKDLNFVEYNLAKFESVEIGHFDCIRDSDLHQGIQFATNNILEDDAFVKLLNEKFGLNTPKLKKQNKSMGSESVRGASQLKPPKSEKSSMRSKQTNEKSVKSILKKSISEKVESQKSHSESQNLDASSMKSKSNTVTKSKRSETKPSQSKEKSKSKRTESMKDIKTNNSKKIQNKEMSKSESGSASSESASSASASSASTSSAKSSRKPPRRGTSIEGKSKRRQAKEHSQSSTSKSMGGQSVHSESIKKLSKPVSKKMKSKKVSSTESESEESSSAPSETNSMKE